LAPIQPIRRRQNNVSKINGSISIQVARLTVRGLLPILPLAGKITIIYLPIVRKVRASNNGTSWSVVWEHKGTTAITDEDWQIVEYDISSIADNQDTVYIRWSYQILDDRAYPYSGWNIDDIQLWGIQL